MKNRRLSCLKSARRIVVKVGSNVLTRDNSLNLEVVYAISRQISHLIDSGLEVILVSSGAVAAGLKRMGLSRRPDALPMRQAVAAVGQARLIMAYERAFEEYDRKVAQILLTGDGLNQRKRYLNARHTLHSLLSCHIIPIINENDTVSVEEIKFGDNDNLSAIIALLVNADLLINLTDIDGLYDKDPRTATDARLIPFVDTIRRDIEQFASSIPGTLGTGGMLSKIRAARKVNTAGIPMIIAQGSQPDILLKLFAGEEYGTFFIPKSHKLTNRKCWIGFTAKPKGEVRIDDGAVRAILRKGKSILPIGITQVEGEFGVGAPVELKNGTGQVLGIGLVNYSATDIRRIMGVHTSDIRARLGENPYDEVIHRDNLTITAEEAG
ncbi:glutamate 5-kinase [Desulfonema ishimotonii]|uniref:Glutamate 5-kinase n=1 Tax=Desulfonema ishimotonii TaxID=45657 RepID=A0A401FQT1_9BACT|nr:glutamate 5-kinase [Desulfonema ishimotonii]GBC59325.1 glutamate 5-kinase [Desulfonema ishimotonii]